MKAFPIFAAVFISLISLAFADISSAQTGHYRRADSALAAPSHVKATSHDPGASASTVIASSAVCGNGIIEHGEECDCGSPQECAKDPCCNAKTCKLVANAQCSNQQDCCDKCQFRPATFVCRTPSLDCNAPEMCTGQSGKCPAKKTSCPKGHSSNASTNTTAINASQDCGSAPCSSRDLQCQAQSSAEMKFMTACAKDMSSCLMSCTDPRTTTLTGSVGSCLEYSVDFADGTECGQGGVCTRGSCVGDKSAKPFYKDFKVLAIGGGCIVASLFFCFLSICCLRRRKEILMKDSKQEESYSMSEILDANHNRRSNMRIGLDPNESGLVDILPPSYDSKKRIQQDQLNGPYASDSLMTDREMALDLESDPSCRLGQSASTWQAAVQNPTDSTWTGAKSLGGSLQRSTSTHMVYVPPPLPPVTLSSPIKYGTPSPYASDAMILFPPDSPPPPPLSSANLSVNDSLAMGTRVDADDQDDDEPSVLHLDDTLTVDRYIKSNNLAKDRASVSSFFSTLAIDPEPILSLPAVPPLPECLFASDEYVMPAPVARITPTAGKRGPSNAISSAVSSPASSYVAENQKSEYEGKQEETQLTACFAHDLGFEIVNPSPVTSPRPAGSTPQ